MFRNTFLIIAFVVFTVKANSQCLVSAHCFSGNANDVSGNSNNGIVNGASLSTDRFGVGNSAYMFDGINDFIELPSTVYNLNSYTYSIWIKPISIPSSSSATKNRYFSVFNVGNYGAAQQILLSNNPSIGHVGLGGGGYNIDGNVVRTNTGTIPAINKWYHLTLTRSNTKIKFYINGAIVDSTVFKSSNAKYNTPIKVSIGARHGDSQFFHGKIDDIKIYNCVLTPSQVFGLFESGTCMVTSQNTLKSKKNELRISPNPTNGDVIIESLNSIINGNIVVYNSTGVVVYKNALETQNEILVPIPEISGIYIIEISSDNIKTSRFKIIKNL